MEQGKDIIVSDTNLRVRYIKRLLKNVDDTYDVELKDFIVDVDTCVKRDAMRPDSERVGEETIREMNKKFPTKTWKTLDEIRAAIGKDNTVYLPYKNNPENEQAILVDINGTLAHHEGRRDIFDYSAVGLDSVDESVRDALIDAHQVGKTVIILSGRSESGREDTEQWLADNGIPYEHLFMRKNGDMRADWIIKDEIVTKRDRHPDRTKFGPTPKRPKKRRKESRRRVFISSGLEVTMKKIGSPENMGTGGGRKKHVPTATAKSSHNRKARKIFSYYSLIQ